MGVVCGILVGGKSRRMGRPKAIIPIGGTTLLERTASIAGSVISDIVLLGRPSFDLPDALSALAIIDDDPAGRGPIGGLAGFFKAKPGCDCLLLACDMPGLDAELLRRLITTAVDDADGVVPRDHSDNSAIHPCCALYRSSAAPVVFDAIAQRRYAMCDLLDLLRIRWLSLEGPQEAAWVDNLNTPADLERHCVTTNGGSMTRPTHDRSAGATR